MKIINVMLLALLFSFNVQAGDFTGNGGDLIFCSHRDKPVEGSDLEGNYVLDYLLANLINPDMMIKYDRPLIALNTVYTKLLEVDQKMGRSLETFLNYYYSSVVNGELSENEPVRWYPFKNLPDLKDELIPEKSLVEILPEHCTRETDLGTIARLRQLITRKAQPSGQIIYFYHPYLLKRISEKTPEQLSWILLHEWLWEFGIDATNNRVVNSYLHTQRFLDDSSQDVLWLFKKYGVIHGDKDEKK